MSEGVAIGIDLGTTNVRVGVVMNGKVEIIANDEGSRVTPSYVAFTDTGKLIGEEAKEQASWNPCNTVFDVKRLIGRKYSDPEVVKNTTKWPFKVVDIDGNLKVEVMYEGILKQFTPEEISAMILRNMKQIAEDFLGREVKDAVVTVPAYFNDSQRQATLDAGAIAGLNVLNILNEPTAAAIAYGVERDKTSESNILIYDLGGGTFDVAILKIKERRIKVLAVNGNTCLGGRTLDEQLMQLFISEMKVKHKVDILDNKRALAKLRNACENVKHGLSSSVKKNIMIENISSGLDFISAISRIRFEELCSAYLESTIDIVKKTLKDARLSIADIDEILVIGESTQIPVVKELLRNFFDNRKINLAIKSDEPVVYGAAMHAAMLSGRNSVEKIHVTDVIPLSLGVSFYDLKMCTLIQRNTSIPMTYTRSFTTALHDNEKEIDFGIFEGEEKLVNSNKKSGDFVAKGIEIAPRGEPRVDVTFSVDSNGVLTATAVDRKTKAESCAAKGRLSKLDIDRMMVEIKAYAERDKIRKQYDEMKHAFEKLCWHAKRANDIKSKNEGISEFETYLLSIASRNGLDYLRDD